MSGGKGGSSTSSVTVPQYIEDAARRNLSRADDISKIGYTPYYGPDVAAFSPMQQAAFQNTANTADAFGMSSPTSQQDIMGGMPAPTTYAGGVQGYSSAPMYEQSLAELGRQRPGQKEFIDSLFIDPYTGEAGSRVGPTVDYTQPPADTGGNGGGGSNGGGGASAPVYTSTDFQGNEAPYTVVAPTTVRPDGFVDNTPGNFTEQRQYSDSSPMGTGGPAIMQSGDGTSVDLGFNLAPSVTGGRGTIVPGQPSNYTGFADMFDGGGKGTSGDTYSGGGAVSDLGNSLTTDVDLPGNAVSRALNIGAGKKDSSSDSGYSGSSGDGCVVATHAVNSGAFSPTTKREAVVWCMNVLHGKWWGEAIRRGYRHCGNKKIEQGKAREHYGEFRRYIDFANGKKRTVAGAITFTLRTAQFFAVGLVKKDA